MASQKIKHADQNAGDIAVIGMAGRFPGAADVNEFWQQLRDGKESITRLSDADLKEEGIDPLLYNAPNYIKAGAILPDIDRFDAGFFNISATEAAIIDPQQRIFLEGAWAALENAGYIPDEYPGRIGVFAGSNMSTYLLQNLNLAGGVHRLVDNVEFLLGNDKDYLSTRVSYKLNLRGPSINVSTACSTSLVAVTLACQSLVDYTCDMALAGGVSVSVPQRSGYLYRDINGGLSADGHCRAFDKSATGTVFGNGMGIIVLKRMSEARKNGDNILAVIRGWAVNNDGSGKVGFMAPGVNGHRDAVIESITMAGIDAATIGYIEAHGTGTVMGDPIEIAALSKAFRHWTGKKQFCAIGSVKTNVGHMVSAAGITGMIKTILALQHRQIPPSLFFEEPNPKINFKESPFYVSTKLQSWDREDHPARAGVSALGVGGTNVHITLEEALPVTSGDASSSSDISGALGVSAGPGVSGTSGVSAGSDVSGTWNIIPLSARSRPALAQMKENLARFLKGHPGTDINNLAYTLQIGRKAFVEREVFLCQTNEEAEGHLQKADFHHLLSHTFDGVDKGLVFLFPGAGDGAAVLGQELYKTEKIFKYWIDRAAAFIKSFTGADLYKQLLSLQKSGKVDALSGKLKEPATGLPFLFAFQYALVKLLESWDIKPAEMIGHSSGEYTVACLSGVMSFETALAVIIRRARLFATLPPGGMLNVNLGEEELRPWMNEHVCISAVNAHDYCMVSGKADAIDQLEQELIKANIACLRIPFNGAPHSFLLDPVLDEMGSIFSSIPLQAPASPYISSFTGRRVTAREVTDPSFWLNQSAQKVSFKEAVSHLLQQNNKLIFVEIGSGTILTPLVRKHKGYNDASPATITLLPLSPKYPSERRALLKSVGQLWLQGKQINWALLQGKAKRQRIQLPGYPFERTSYWLNNPRQGDASGNGVIETPDLLQSVTTKKATEDWFYVPSWIKCESRERPSSLSELSAQRILLFMDENGMMDHLAEELLGEGHEVMLVRAGAEYGRDSRDVFHFSPAVYGSYLQLMNTLRTEGLLPDRIVHGWLLDSNNGALQDWEMFQRSQEKGFYSLMLLTQAASKVIGGSTLDIHVLSTGLCAMEDTTSMDTSKSTILGVINCIDREFFNIRCQSIDVIVPPVGNRWQSRQLAKFITGEIIHGPGPEERSILYRVGEKWRRVYRPFPHLPGQAPALRLKEKGVYLITGGSGNLGMLLCEHLASHYDARVMLISRRRVLDPEKQEKIRLLQEKGWNVEWMSADIGLEADLVKVRERIGTLYGAVDGIFHFAADITENAFFTIDNFQLEGVLQNFVPKVQGLINVRKVFGSEPLDFILLASSQSAILGGLGNSAYAAANIYLDQSALREGALSPYPMISINWDLWEGTSDSHNSARQEKSSSIEILLRNVVIKPEEGMQAIEMALAAGVPHLVVSTSDFNARIAYTKAPGGRRNKDKAPLNGGHLSANYVAPRNEIESKIAEVWQYALGIDKIGVHDNFFELGGDSLQAVRMLPQLQAVLQKEIPLRDLIMDPTIAGIAEIALNGKTKAAGEDSPILLQLKKPGTAEKSRRLVCIPYAGGNAIIYQSLVQSLPDSYDVYAINPPLYDGAESLENGQDIQTFAQRCLKEILEKGEQKLSLYGHCGGSVLTLEIASLLESRGVEVEKVFLGAVLPLTERDLAVLPDPTNLEAFTNEQMYKFLVQLGGIDSALSFENSSEIINGFRLDAINSFQYYQEIDRSGAFKKLKAPIIALIGDADPLMNDYRNRYKQWGKFSQEVFLEVIQGGGHYFIKDRASEVSGIIKRYLKTESVVLS